MRFLFKFYLILSSCFAVSTFATEMLAPVLSPSSCRSYFIQTHVLNAFTEYERNALEAAARSLADLIGNSNSQHLDAKKNIDLSILNFISRKHLQKEEGATVLAWFKERIQFYINLKRSPAILTTAEKQHTADILNKQKETFQVELEKIRTLIKKYNARTLSEALISSNASNIEDYPSKHEDISFMLDHYEFLDVEPETFSVLVQYDRISAIEHFIRQGISLSFENVNKFTALHLAVKHNPNPKIIQLLLATDQGAQLNSQTVAGNTPLHLATQNPHPNTILKMLLEAGADVFHMNVQNQLPLHIAASNPKIEIEIFRLFLKIGALEQLDSRDYIERTPLHIAAREKNINAVRLFLESGADISLLDQANWTVLHCAAAASNAPFDLFQLLIAADPSQLSSRNHSEEVPLHLAVQNTGDPKIIEYFIQADAGAQVNERDNDGKTPLHIAIFNSTNSVNIIKILLAAGANPTLKNNFSETPYESTLILRPSLREAQPLELVKELLRQAIKDWEKTHP